MRLAVQAQYAVPGSSAHSRGLRMFTSMAVVELAHTQVFERHSTLSPRQAAGVEALIIVSFLSLLVVVVLLAILALCAAKETHCRTRDGVVRSHVAAYLVSLLVTDLLQGSIMNLKWVNSRAVDLGGFCTAQGAITQAADVGAALWVLVIAIHTFNVLFLGFHVRRHVMYVVLLGGWCFIGAVVSVGPYALETASRGPYFGISGFWCWISRPYYVEKFVLEYMIMFISAFFSFILYSLVFLRLRGNVMVAPGGRIRFRCVDKGSAWTLYHVHETSESPAHMISVAKHMLLYPIAYTILIVPIAAARFSEWTGHKVPLGAMVFSDSVFLLSGFVNATLFVTTGRVLPYTQILTIFKCITKHGASVARGDTEGDRSEESQMKTLSSTSSTAHDNEKDLPEPPNYSLSLDKSPEAMRPLDIVFERRGSDSSASETSTVVG